MGTLSPHVYSVTKLRKALLARIHSEGVVDVILQPATPGHYQLLWDGLFPRRVCPLAVFAGKSGILELMGGYTGHILGRETRIVRQLTELLPGVIAELDRRGPRRQKDAADELRRRLLDAGSPVEDDETARQKMRDAEVYERGGGGIGEYDGFDPDNFGDVKCLGPFHDAAITPMGYFARIGDLPMMRWLYVNGADTRDVDVPANFPMRMAAVHVRLEACKWLLLHGAGKDVKRRTPQNATERVELVLTRAPIHWFCNGISPLTETFSRANIPAYRNVCHWLILNGALCKDDASGVLDVATMRKDLGQVGQPAFRQERSELLEWAKEHHQSRSLFGVFLMGTLSSHVYSVTKLRKALLVRTRSEGVVDVILQPATPGHYHLLWDGLFPHRVCPLAVFAGETRILRLIGDCAGIMHGRDARIVRQLTELLPGVIAELDRRRSDHDANISSA